VKEAGDAFLVAFPAASDALACAVSGQRALSREPWPEAVGALPVRMALHTGDVQPDAAGEDYHGLVLHRASRMLHAAHGGQILVSEATAALVRRDLEMGVRLADLGLYRLRDVESPERLFQSSTRTWPGASSGRSSPSAPTAAACRFSSPGSLDEKKRSHNFRRW
jgi:class 3 adenylate cyclase